MIDLAKVERVMGLMIQYGMENVQLENGSEKIALTRPGTHSVGSVDSFPPPRVESLKATSNLSTSTLNASTPTPSPAPKEEAVPDGQVIPSPFVGTFYRAPNPESPAFVQKGDRVKKGQILCIVEAMKLMNEIESECDGEVVAILVENAKPVEFGTPLFVVRA
jgi:acetyl-CoA carboxylase biotin carboxyl carrier protein